MIDYSRQREREWASNAPGFEVNSVMAIVSWFTFEAINTPLVVHQEWRLWDLHLRLLSEWHVSVGLVSNYVMKYMFITAFIYSAVPEKVLVIQRSKPVEYFIATMLT